MPDNDDWTIACQYIATNLCLRKLVFDTLVRAVPRDFEREPWVRALITIKGLQQLEQVPGLQHLKTILLETDDPDTDLTEELENRLRSLLRYLRSEMLAPTAPHPKTLDGGSNMMTQHLGSH